MGILGLALNLAISDWKAEILSAKVEKSGRKRAIFKKITFLPQEIELRVKDTFGAPWLDEFRDVDRLKIRQSVWILEPKTD